jgi:alanine racemase
MKPRNTSIDIAYKAGVSQSTVSRALSGSNLVSEETRQKIIKIAEEMNYKVDKNASNLRTQSSHTIALLLFEDPSTDDSNINPFYLSMLGSITRACALAGYDLLVSFQQMSADWHSDFEDCHKADGIILLGYGDFQFYEEKLLKLIEQQTHFVVWGASAKHITSVSVSCDNFQGGFDITQHLIEQGKQHFVFLGQASSSSPEFLARNQGHCAALTEAGLLIIKTKPFNGDFSEQSGYEAMMNILNEDRTVDAVVAACDLIAIGAMNAIKEKGLSVGKDISVVGYDDISIARFTNPPLSTVHQDTNLAGELLVNSLVDLIAGKTVETTIMQAKLVLRESSLIK